MEPSIRPLPGASLHVVGDEGVILDALQQKIYSADRFATLVWCHLEEGADIRQIVRLLAQDHAMPRREALRSVATVLAAWRNAGLVGRRASGEIDPVPSRINIARASARPVPTRPSVAWRAEETYRLLGTDIRLRFDSSALADVTRAAFGHVSVGARHSAAVTLDILSKYGGISVSARREHLDRCDDVDQLVPMLHWMLLDVALARSGDFCALHAAAVSRHGEAIALIGPSGSGKSTLAAALVGQGFGYVADDTLVLEKDTLHARILGLGFCLKAGAWEAVAPYCRELTHRRSHRRQDGKIVRYLPPCSTPWASGDGGSVPVRAILFPRYAPGDAARLTPVAAVEAVKRILPQCRPLGSGFDRHRLDRLIGWIETRQCFDFSFSDLAAAGAAVRRLWRP